MKAIYEVKFLYKRDPTKINDSRRIAADASTKGLKQIVAWAENVCGDEEFVGGIELVASEQL